MRFPGLALAFIALMLVIISMQISAIASRLKKTFPTAAEKDRQWAKSDPAGYWEARRKQAEMNAEMKKSTSR